MSKIEMKKLLIISLLLIGCGSEKEQTFVCDCKQKEKAEAFIEKQLKIWFDSGSIITHDKAEPIMKSAYLLYCTKVDSNYQPPQDTSKSGIGLDYCLSFKIKVKI
jgi:hypothetical protein